MTGRIASRRLPPRIGADEPPPERPAEEAGGSGELGLADVGRFLLRHGRLLLGAAAIAALATALVVRFLVPPRYEGVALVGVNVVEEPPIPLRLSLPLRTYQEILDSRRLRQATRERLAAAGIGSEAQRLELTSRVGRPLEGRGQPEGATTLRLVASARSAEAAATAANAWAGLFVAEASARLDRRAGDELERLERYATGARGKLADLRERSARHAEAVAGRKRHLQRRNAARAIEHERETASLRRAFELETRDLLREGSRSLVAAEGELAAARAAQLRVGELEGEAAVALERARARLAVFTEAAGPEPLAVPLLEGRAELAASERGAEVARERAAELTRRRADLEATVAGLRAEVEDLELSRRTALEDLLLERRAVAQRLAINQDAALRRLDDQARLEATRLEHELATARERVSQVDTLIGSAGASLAQNPFVWLVEEAAPPSRPLPSRLALKVAVATVVGLLLGLVVAGLRESSA